MNRLRYLPSNLALIVVGVAMLASAGAFPAAAQSSDQPASAAPDGLHATIAASAESFAGAYNAHDAALVAGLFAPDAEFIDGAGNAFQGRQAIEKEFAAFFAEFPQSTMEVSVAAVRLVSPGVAIEDGASSLRLTADARPKSSRYTAVHVQQDGKWKVASVRPASADGSSAHERLQALAWLIGEWVDEGAGLVVDSTFAWDASGSYLIHRFEITAGGALVQQGVERIGWDPQQRVLRSWAFDSQGGHTQSRWSATESGWLIQTSGYRADGASAASEQQIEQISAERFRWTATDRIIGEEQLPSAGLLMVRKPPAPQSPHADGDDNGSLE